MNIIVLSGKNNCGKSTTLNIVYTLILQNGGVSTNKKVEGDPNQNDFSDIVLWRNKRIAFFTMGDFSKYLVNAINRYDRQNCDLLVCAISTNQPFIRARKTLNKFNPTPINKTVVLNAYSELSVNIMDAQNILNRI